MNWVQCLRTGVSGPGRRETRPKRRLKLGTYLIWPALKDATFGKAILS